MTDVDRDEQADGQDACWALEKGTVVGAEWVGTTRDELMGRRTLYDPTYHPGEVRKLAEKGLIEQEIADQFGVSRATLSEWKNRFPDFLDALKRGKRGADRLIEAAAFRRATTGGKVRIVHYSPPKVEGDPAVPIRIIEREVPPDLRAIEFWLCNRAPNRWKRHVNLNTAQGFGRSEEKDPEKIKTILKNLRRVLVDEPISQKAYKAKSSILSTKNLPWP